MPGSAISRRAIFVAFPVLGLGNAVGGAGNPLFRRRDVAKDVTASKDPTELKGVRQVGLVGKEGKGVGPGTRLGMASSYTVTYPRTDIRRPSSFRFNPRLFTVCMCSPTPTRAAKADVTSFEVERPRPLRPPRFGNPRNCTSPYIARTPLISPQLESESHFRPAKSSWPRFCYLQTPEASERCAGGCLTTPTRAIVPPLNTVLKKHGE